MANRERVIVALVVLFGGLMLTGCQTYSNSKLENEVYNYVDRFSRRIPKGFAKKRDGKEIVEVLYHDPSMVVDDLDLANFPDKGAGRVMSNLLGSFGPGTELLRGGYFEMENGETKSYVFFMVESKLLKPHFFALAKSRRCVVYARPDRGLRTYSKPDIEGRSAERLVGEWKRCEMFVEIDNFDFRDLYRECLKPTVPWAPKGRVERYLSLLDRLNKTYFKQERADWIKASRLSSYIE